MGPNWRLGLILGLTTTNDNIIMPIGHGQMKIINASKKDENLRPFQAFSVPPCTISNLKNMAYDEIAWEKLIDQTESTTRDVLAIDASKLASTKVDYSFSLFNPLDDGTQAMSHFAGVFLGAERVELGDALRVRSASDLIKGPDDTGPDPEAICALGVRQILTSRSQPGVWFRGSEFLFVHPNDPLTKVRPIVPPDALPPALREETLWRSQHVKPSSSTTTTTTTALNNPKSVWILLAEDITHEENTIMGRYYPTSRLLPILNPNAFQAVVASGEMNQGYMSLNNRMSGEHRYLGRRKNRVETLGATVPHGARFAFETYVREDAGPGGDGKA